MLRFPRCRSSLRYGVKLAKPNHLHFRPLLPEIERNRRAYSTRHDLVQGSGLLSQNQSGPVAFSGPQQNIKLIIDPQKVTEFSQLQLDPTIVSALSKALPEVIRPTKIQKSMIAALKSDLSIVARSAPGAGKTLATILYLLSTPRQSSTIANLVLVPSEHLATQYYEIIKKLLGNLKQGDVLLDQTAQKVYRTRSKIRKSQDHLLKRTPNPHILIATPTRLLDMLSTGEDSKRHLLPLYNLQNVVIDEADHLLPKDKYMKRSKSSILSPIIHNRPPTDILMAHLTAWRSTHMHRNGITYSPMRLILQSSTAGGYLRTLSPGTAWIHQRPIIKIGLDQGSGVHTNRLPRDVDAYSVTYNPHTMKLQNSELPTLTVDEALSPESAYSLKKPQRRFPPPATNFKRAALVDAFVKVFTLEKKQRGVLIIPPELNPTLVAIQLKAKGINAAYSTLNETGRSMSMPSVIKRKKVKQLKPVSDPQNLFSRTISEEEPDILIYDTTKALGLHFPELSRVYILSWSAVYNSSRKFLALAGRCRLSNAHEKGEQGRDGQWIPPTGQQRGKVINIDIEDNETPWINHQISLAMTKLDIDVGDYTRSVDMKTK